MCLKVMSVGATRGVFTAVERMSTKKGGNGGRIVNTASVAGIMVTVHLKRSGIEGFPTRCVFHMRNVKADLHDVHLMRSSAADSCVSAEIGNCLIFFTATSRCSPERWNI